MTRVATDRRDIRSLVFGEGLRLVGGGVVIGAIVSLGVARALRSLLSAIEAGDPVTFGIALLLFAAVTTLACWAPTRRALRVDPAEALRSEYPGQSVHASADSELREAAENS